MRWGVIVALVGCAPRSSHLESQLESEVIALSQTVRRLELRAETCDDAVPPDRLFAELTQVFANTEVEVTRVGGGTKLMLPATHLYRDAGDSRVRDEAFMLVDLLGTALAVNPLHQILVVGHTSDRSVPVKGGRSFGSRLDLSAFLAISVAERLIAGFEIAPERVTISARGMWDPVASNDLSAGQDANERVEITLSPPSD